MAIKINGTTVLDNDVSRNSLTVGQNSGTSSYLYGYFSSFIGRNLLANRDTAGFSYQDTTNILLGSDIASGNNTFQSSNPILTNVTGSLLSGEFVSTSSTGKVVSLPMQSVNIVFTVSTLGNMLIGLGTDPSLAVTDNNFISRGLFIGSAGDASYKTSDAGYAGGQPACSAGDKIQLLIGNGQYKVTNITTGVVLWTASSVTVPANCYFVIGFRAAGIRLSGIRLLTKAYSSMEFSFSPFETNTIIGSNIGNSLINCANTTILGQYSLNSATSLTNSVFIGNFVLEATTSTDSTVSIGNKSLGTNTTGTWNTAIGDNAGFSNTTGSNNTFIGKNSGLGAQSTSSYQTITGNNLTLLGYQSRPSSGTVNNEITLGNSSVASLRCAVTSITSLSDGRDKTDVLPLVYGLDFINNLNPVSFTWASRDGTKTGIKSSGFIAQDLKATQELFNASETLNLVYDSDPDKLEATYGNLIPVLVKSVQELSKKVAELQLQISNI